MHIAVVGAGYVGLTVAVALADRGHKVTCVDKDAAKVRLLEAGKVPFYEEGLDDYLTRGLAAGTLRFTTSITDVIDDAELIFIAVGTPSKKDGRADLSALRAVAYALVQHSPTAKTVVVKSTVPVGTGDRLERYLRERTGRDWDVVSNPEFLREGSALADYLQPDRIIIGAESPEAAEQVRAVYEGFPAPILIVDRRTAELTKYVANGFLAAKISLINEIGDLCERVGVDVREVSKGVGLDHRIGPHFMQAGLGYGGSCFPKDVAALIRQFQDHNERPRILRAVQRVNESRRRRFLRLVRQYVPRLKGSAVAVWGLTFKPGTDDLRHAPSLEIVPMIQALGARVHVYDPVVNTKATTFFPTVHMANSPIEAAVGAEAVLVLTDWPEFVKVDFRRLKQVMARPVIIDGRGIFSPKRLEKFGFEYRALGRGEGA